MTDTGLRAWAKVLAETILKRDAGRTDASDNYEAMKAGVAIRISDLETELAAAEAREQALRERVEGAADRHGLKAIQFSAMDEPDPDKPGHTFHERSIEWHETIAKELRAALLWPTNAAGKETP